MKEKEKKKVPSPAELLSGKKKEAEKPAKKGKKKHHFRRTVVEHHGNNSHTVRHEHESGKPEDNVEYAVNDMAGVHSGLDDNLGQGGSEEAPEAAAAGGPGAAGPGAGAQ